LSAEPSVTLGSPGDLAGFPATRPPKLLHRVCRRAHGTWWFSADGSGRFDLRPPHGTCYFATDAYGAIRAASRLGPVSDAWVVARDLRVVQGALAGIAELRLAATTHKRAGRYGITNELITIVPYTLPQKWAAAFREHGFGGVRHLLRHDQRGRPRGVSVFGAAGAGKENGGDDRRPLDEATVRGAGVVVIATPSSSVLNVVD
jgi:hypothetical protein